MDPQQLCWDRLEFALAVVRDDGIGRRDALQLGPGGTNVIRTQAAAALEGHGRDDEIGRRCSLVYLRACSGEGGGSLVVPCSFWVESRRGRRGRDSSNQVDNGGKPRRRLRMDRMEEYSVC